MKLKFPRVNKKVLFIIKLFLTIIILYVLIRKIELSKLITAFAQVKVDYFLIAVALVPLNFFWQIVKWHYMVTRFQDVSWKVSSISLIGGYAAMLVTPGRAGELIRTLYYPNEQRLYLAGLVLLDKIFAFLAIVFFAAIGFFLTQAKYSFSISVTALLGIFALIVYPKIFRSISDFLSKLLKRELVFHLSSQELFITFLFSLAFFLTYAVQYLALINAIESVGVFVWIQAFPLTMFVNTFSFTIGGLGIREGAAVYFFGKFGGVNPASAMNASLMLYTINVLFPGIVGTLTLPQITLRPSEDNHETAPGKA